MFKYLFHNIHTKLMWIVCGVGLVWFFFIKIYCNRTCEWNGKVIGIFTLILYYYYFLSFFFLFAFLLKNFIVIPVRTQSQPFGLNNSFWGLFSKGEKVLFSWVHLAIWIYLMLLQVEISIINLWLVTFII